MLARIAPDDMFRVRDLVNTTTTTTIAPDHIHRPNLEVTYAVPLVGFSGSAACLARARAGVRVRARVRVRVGARVRVRVRARRATV